MSASRPFRAHAGVVEGSGGGLFFSFCPQCGLISTPHLYLHLPLEQCHALCVPVLAGISGGEGCGGGGGAGHNISFPPPFTQPLTIYFLALRQSLLSAFLRCWPAVLVGMDVAEPGADSHFYLPSFTQPLTTSFLSLSVGLRCWPAVLAGGDVEVVAEPGAGKTLGYLLPCAELLVRGGQGAGTQPAGPLLLVVLPTR